MARARFKIEDAEAIRREVPGVIAVSEEVVSTAQVAAGNQNWFTRILRRIGRIFRSPAMAARRWRAIYDQDVRSANKVCVIGRTTADADIYGNEDPSVRFLRVKNVPFLITGVLTPEGIQPPGHRPGRRCHHALHQRDETSAGRRNHFAKYQRAGASSRRSSRPPSSKSSSFFGSVITSAAGRDDDFTVRNAGRNRRRLPRRRPT